MQESEIRDLLSRHLMNTDDIEWAFSMTLWDVYPAVLGSIVGENSGIGPKGLDILKKLIKTKCRMTVIAFVNSDEGQILVPGGAPEIFLEIYLQFRQTIQFLKDNLQNLRFGSRVRKETIAGMLDKISDPTAERYRRMKAEGGGTSNMAELAGIDKILNLALQLILGEEIFGKFGDEINTANAILKRLRNKFGLPTDPESQSDSRPN